MHMSMDRDAVRCQGCGEAVETTKINRRRVTNSREVRYCNRCEALRDRYDILLEDHRQYCLPDLADELERRSVE
jgi:NAD-dependent SIR2 family protein deacetylase